MADLQHVQGLKALQDSLKQLPDNVARNVLRGAVNAGASVVSKAIKDKAPIYIPTSAMWGGGGSGMSKNHPPPGTLKRSIVQKQIKEMSSLFKQVFYVTVRRGKKYAKQGKDGSQSQDAYYAAWVEWGTSKMAARPFMRPGWEGSKQTALEAIKDYLAKRIPLEAAKLPFWRR